MTAIQALYECYDRLVDVECRVKYQKQMIIRDMLKLAETEKVSVGFAEVLKDLEKELKG